MLYRWSIRIYQNFHAPQYCLFLIHRHPWKYKRNVRVRIPSTILHCGIRYINKIYRLKYIFQTLLYYQILLKNLIIFKSLYFQFLLCTLNPKKIIIPKIKLALNLRKKSFNRIKVVTFKGNDLYVYYYFRRNTYLKTQDATVIIHDSCMNAPLQTCRPAIWIDTCIGITNSIWNPIYSKIIAAYSHRTVLTTD